MDLLSIKYPIIFILDAVHSKAILLLGIFKLINNIIVKQPREIFTWLLKYYFILLLILNHGEYQQHH